MIINVGDKIKDSHDRVGEIINIGIDQQKKRHCGTENDTSLNDKDL